MAFTVDTLYKLFSPYKNKYTSVSTTPIDRAFASSYSMLDDTDDIKDTSKITNTLAQVYLDTIRTRNELYDAVDGEKESDTGTLIIDSVIDDAFNSMDTEQPFTVCYTGNRYDANFVNDEIEDFLTKFDVYALFNEIMEETVTYGERHLETPVEIGKGIVDINDTVNSRNVISLYKNNTLIEHIGFINHSEFIDTRYQYAANNIVRIHRDLLTHFTLDSKRIKLRLDPKGTLIGLPEVIKVGRPILYNALRLLKRGLILDTAILAKDVRAALLPVLLGISTSNTKTAADAIQLAKNVEKYLADNVGMDGLAEGKDITMSQLYANAAKFKGVPISSDGRGSLSALNIDSDTSSIKSSYDATVDRARGVVGLPDRTEKATRFEILKSQSRYSKKLIDIQRCGSRGIRDLVCKQLRYKNIYVQPSNIQVQCKSLVNPDMLEEGEGLISMISVCTDINTFIQSLVDNEKLGVGVHSQMLINVFQQLLGGRYQMFDGMLYKKKVTKQPSFDQGGSNDWQ
jgi:hypothetical protein